MVVPALVAHLNQYHTVAQMVPFPSLELWAATQNAHVLMSMRQAQLNAPLWVIMHLNAQLVQAPLTQRNKQLKVLTLLF